MPPELQDWAGVRHRHRENAKHRPQNTISSDLLTEPQKDYKYEIWDL